MRTERAILLLLCLLGCGDPSPDNVVLTIDVEGPGRVVLDSGVECVDGCALSLPVGGSVGLRAIAGEGAAFVGWGGACGGGDDCTVEMDGARSVVAVFTTVCGDSWVLSLGMRAEPGFVAVAPGGDVVVGGAFSGVLVIEGRSVMSSGGEDAFVARFDGRSCGLRWLKGFGGSGRDRVTGMAVDESGNVAVSGLFEGTLGFGLNAHESAGGTDAFYAMLSGANGVPLWSVSAGGEGEEDGASVAVGGGTVVGAASFRGRAGWFGRELTSAGESDVGIFALRSSTGEARWVRRLGGAEADTLGAVALANGEVVLAGDFGGRLGGTELVAMGSSDGFMARLSGGAGNVVWARSVGGEGDTSVRSAVVDSGGGVVFAVARGGVCDMLRLDRETGDELWRVSDVGGGCPEVAVDGESVWMASDGGLRGLDLSSGEVLSDGVLPGGLSGVEALSVKGDRAVLAGRGADGEAVVVGVAVESLRR